MIIDRINTLLLNLNMPPVRDLQLTPSRMNSEDTRSIPFRSMTPAHDLLDTIDSHVGIRTRKNFATNAPAPVGERVRRLERHMDAKRAPPFFWLGANAVEAAPA